MYVSGPTLAAFRRRIAASPSTPIEDAHRAGFLVNAAGTFGDPGRRLVSQMEDDDPIAFADLRDDELREGSPSGTHGDPRVTRAYVHFIARKG